MSVKTGTATSYTDLLNILDTFLTSTGMALVPSFTGTGNGTISALGGSAGVAETITVTFSSATAFSVAGSVSGALGSGTVGTPFTSTKANLTVTAGTTAFVSGDVFTFDVTPPWTSLRRVSGSEMIWQGPGNGGLDQIIVGAKVFSDVGGDYYNWRLGAFTGFDAGLDFIHQSGYVGGAGQLVSSPSLALWNSSIPYWIVANGRRVIVIAHVSTVYVSCYIGFIDSYMSPGAFPYPMLVGGCLAFVGSEPVVGSTTWRWSYTGDEMHNYPTPKSAPASVSASEMVLRLPSGSWQGFGEQESSATIGQVWPYAYALGWDWRPDLDGGYSLVPIVLFDETPNIYGELDGVFGVTGFGQSAENTVTIGGIPHLVVPDVFRNGKQNFHAVRLA